MAQDTQTTKVGARQFRENFANYIGHADQPIAITRHGDTVGYYIPTRPKRSDDEKNALKEAVARLHEVLNVSGISSDEIFEELRTLQTKVASEAAVEPVEENKAAQAQRGA
jgi:PHD/YefM family antitoxin component YafN of YafNO toxin-antitoxin module